MFVVEPRISVVIPVFDRAERMLHEAIDSVLAQTHPADEVVVVDDGSAEPVAPEIERRYGDVVDTIRRENGGIGAARNTGIEHTSGEWLAFLDSDDIWVPDKLERQVAVLESDPDLDAVYGLVEQFYDPEATPEFRERHPIKLPVGEALLSTAQLIRRESFERIGPFDHRSAAVDVEWQFRARDLGVRHHVLDHVVYRRRVHPGNIGVSLRDEGNRQRLLAIKASLDRRRATNGLG